MNAYNSMPCTIAYDVGFETVSEIEVRSLELDGIDITESTSRVYPQGKVACHIIGYISKISSTKLEDYRSQGYPNDAFIGADGIENSLEDQLSPYIAYRQGQRVVEVNTRGKVVRELSYTAPTDGNSVVLTIDVDLQKVMAEALEDNIEEIRERQEKDIASDRCSHESATLILASATPSILSFAKARRGDYMLLEMPRRVQDRPMPEVQLVDMRTELETGNRSVLSRALSSALISCMQKELR